MLFIVSSCERVVRHHPYVCAYQYMCSADEVFRVQSQRECVSSEREDFDFCYSVLCVAHSRAPAKRLKGVFSPNPAFFQDLAVCLCQTSANGTIVRLRWLPLPERFIVHTETQLDYFPSPPTYNRPGAHHTITPTYTRSENENRSPRESREHRRAGGVSVALRWQGAADTHTHT